MLYLSSITVWVWSCWNSSKWCFVVPSITNEDGENPNIRHINRNTTVYSISRSLIQLNLIAFRTLSLILICRKACFKSPVIGTSFKRHRISTFQSVFCNAGPISKHSFIKGLAFVGLADAPYTIRSLVVPVNCFTTGLCGIWNFFDVAVSGASLTIHSVGCPFILSS